MTDAQGTNNTSTKADLIAEVHQSACNKVVDSVQYPLQVIDHQQPFPGFSLVPKESEDRTSDDGSVDIALEDLLALLVARKTTFTNEITAEDELADELDGVLDIMLANREACKTAYDKMRAHNESRGPDEQLEWNGPSLEELDSEITNLKILREGKIGDQGLTRKVLETKGHVPLFRLNVQSVPTLEVGGADLVKLSKVNLRATGVGEVWIKYTWIKCVKKILGICVWWKTVKKTKCLIRLSISNLKIKAAVHVDLKIDGALVKVFAVADYLRLQHGVLQLLPLEGIANKQLRKKPVTVFDASAFVATFPVLGSSFRIASVSVPPTVDRLTIGLTVIQV